jgi:hypothetical protein
MQAPPKEKSEHAEEVKGEYKDALPVSDVEYTSEPTDEDGNFVCDHCHFAFILENFELHTDIVVFLKSMRSDLGPSAFKHETKHTADGEKVLKAFLPHSGTPWLCKHCGLYFTGADLKTHLKAALAYKLKMKAPKSTKKGY